MPIPVWAIALVVWWTCCLGLALAAALGSVPPPNSTVVVPPLPDPPPALTDPAACPASPTLPAYAPLFPSDPAPTGTYRVACDAATLTVVQNLLEMYHLQVPKLQLQAWAVGAPAAPAFLQQNFADVAILSRELSPAEVAPLSAAWGGAPPLEVPLATGAVAAPGFSPAAAVVVPAANTWTAALSMTDLDGI